MRILLAVCGSISAYKSLDLARGLVNLGHQVRVVLTTGATAFVVPQVFRYLGVEQVYHAQDDFKHPQNPHEAPVLHVELAQWTQKLVIAPLSANTLANLAMGKADDLLSSIFLALSPSVPVLFFPAMNTQMLAHPIVQDNKHILERLERLPQVWFAPTQSGKLACGDVGDGKLLSVEEILTLAPVVTPKASDQKKHIVITTGATVAPMDPVRYLTNPSSGKTGVELALAFHQMGHEVTLIHGQTYHNQLNTLSYLPRTRLIKALTTHQMHQAVMSVIESADVYISAAAIGDFEFKMSEHKLKKSQRSSTMEMIASVDILQEVINKKISHLKIVGFAAETDLSDEVIQEKLNRKPVDLLIATKVHHAFGEGEQMGFSNDNAHYKVYQQKQLMFGGELAKQELAQLIGNQFHL